MVKLCQSMSKCLFIFIKPNIVFNMADMKHLQFLWHDSNMIFPVLSKLCKILIKLGKRPAP